MAVREAGVRAPHDRLELGELLEEARPTVVDLLRRRGDWLRDQKSGRALWWCATRKLTGGVRVGLDEPEPVLLGRVLVAGDLLLLEAPVGELDLVAEQDRKSVV